MSISTAVVLAAGEGTRLRPLTHNRPKPMLPAANQPILQHVLDALVEAGMDRIIIVVGYRRDRVQEYFGPHYRDVPVEYVKQEKQLGSGHALLQVRRAVDGPVLVVNGDQLVGAAGISRVAQAFGDGGTVVGVVERADASRYGVVELDGQQVSALIEKPDRGDYRLLNAGVYAFDEEIFDVIEETPLRDGELFLPDVIGRQIDSGAVRAVRLEGLWADATYPWDLLDVATEILERGRAAQPKQRDGVWVDSDARIHDSAVLQPPVVVGPDCEVGPSTVVGPNVALAQNTTVGANVTLDRAVVDSDCRIGHGSTLVDTVLGQDVHLGVNVTVPGGPADVRVGNQIFEEQHLGAVLADRVQAGGNATFEPGTLVGTAASIGTGATVGGHVPDNSEVIR